MDPQSHFDLYTDACQSGYGAYFAGDRLYGSFPDHDGPNPLQPGLRLKQTLRGIERKYFSSPKQETMLTFDILSDRYSDLYHPNV